MAPTTLGSVQSRPPFPLGFIPRLRHVLVVGKKILSATRTRPIFLNVAIPVGILVHQLVVARTTDEAEHSRASAEVVLDQEDWPCDDTRDRDHSGKRLQRNRYVCAEDRLLINRCHDNAAKPQEEYEQKANMAARPIRRYPVLEFFKR